jgi:hypothetical protein
MNDQDPDFQQYLNPDYGNGIFRRRIRLAGSNGMVLAELEDTNHGFRSRVFHDGERVTDIQAGALRIPLSTCGGATEPIKQLIGTAIDTPAKTITTRVDPRANCTHLYDLTLLAIGHCQRGASTRQYDMEVDDEVGEAAAESRVYCNGELVLRWQARQWLISEGPFCGKPLYKGFAAWANEAYSGDEQEAAFALQKAYFVSQARRYNMNSMAGTPANDQTAMHGVCYSYSAEVIDSAIRTADNVRDFTNTPEQLLKFL